MGNDAEIEESYISIAGGWSENDGAVYAPGSMILNRVDESRPVMMKDGGTFEAVETETAPAKKQ